jgi:hypothetical protein
MTISSLSETHAERRDRITGSSFSTNKRSGMAFSYGLRVGIVILVEDWREVLSNLR